MCVFMCIYVTIYIMLYICYYICVRLVMNKLHKEVKEQWNRELGPPELRYRT